MNEIKEFRMTLSGLKKRDQIRATGVAYVAAPCANCKRQLGQLMEHHPMRVAVGGVHDFCARSAVFVPAQLERYCHQPTRPKPLYLMGRARTRRILAPTRSAGIELRAWR